MKDNNLMKYKEMKRRLMALVLASSIGITSFGLAGCGKRKIETQGETNGYYDVCERDNNLKVYFTDEWFCGVWAEDYDNNNEKVHLMLKDFSYGYCITHPERVAKIVLQK